MITDHNQWLAACFVGYVVLIFVFATVYYSLYRQRPERFLFAAGVRDTQMASFLVDTQRRIQSLAAEIEALAFIEQRMIKGAIASALASQRIEGTLPSGCYFVLYMAHQSQSPSAPGIPTIELRDPSGNELARVPLALPWWFGQRWGEAFLKRRSKNEGQIALLERRLSLLQVDPYDIWSFWDFVYFSAICQTTVGFGDILPDATAVRMLVVCQIVLGYAILAFLLNVVFHP